MAKNRGTRDSNLIGAGGKRITPVNGSYTAGYNKAYGTKKPEYNVKKNPTKKQATATMQPTIKPTKQVARVRGIKRLQQQITKTTPTKTKSKTVSKKPVIKGPKK